MQTLKIPGPFMSQNDSLPSFCRLAWEHAIDEQFWRAHADEPIRLRVLGELASALCAAISIARPEFDPQVWEEITKLAKQDALDDARARGGAGILSLQEGGERLGKDQIRALAQGIVLGANPQQRGCVIDALSGVYVFRPNAQAAPDEHTWKRLGREAADEMASNASKRSTTHILQFVRESMNSAENELGRFRDQPPAAQADEELAQRAKRFFIEGDLGAGPAPDAAQAALRSAMNRAMSGGDPFVFKLALDALLQGAQGAPLTEDPEKKQGADGVREALRGQIKFWIGLLIHKPQAAQDCHAFLRLALSEHALGNRAHNPVIKDAWMIAALKDDPSPKAINLFLREQGLTLPTELPHQFHQELSSLEDSASCALGQLYLANTDLGFAFDEAVLARALSFLSAAPIASDQRGDPPGFENPAVELSQGLSRDQRAMLQAKHNARQKKLKLAFERMQACGEALAELGNSLAVSDPPRWARINQTLRDHGAAAWAVEMREPSLAQQLQSRNPLTPVIEALQSGQCPGSAAAIASVAGSLWACRAKISSQLEREELTALPLSAPREGASKARL